MCFPGIISFSDILMDYQGLLYLAAFVGLIMWSSPRSYGRVRNVEPGPDGICPPTMFTTTRFGSLNETRIVKSGLFQTSVRGFLTCENSFSTSVHHRTMVTLPISGCTGDSPIQGQAVAEAIAQFCAGADWLRQFDRDLFTGPNNQPVVVRESDIPASVAIVANVSVVTSKSTLRSLRAKDGKEDDSWVALRDPLLQSHNIIVFERWAYHLLWQRESSHPQPPWAIDQVRLGLAASTVVSRRDGIHVAIVKSGYERLDNLRIVLVVPSPEKSKPWWPPFR